MSIDPKILEGLRNNTLVTLNLESRPPNMPRKKDITQFLSGINTQEQHRGHDGLIELIKTINESGTPVNSLDYAEPTDIGASTTVEHDPDAIKGDSAVDEQNMEICLSKQDFIDLANALKKNTSLRELNLSGNYYGIDIVRLLSDALANHPSLVVLLMDDNLNHYFGSDDLDQLRKALKKSKTIILFEPREKTRKNHGLTLTTPRSEMTDFERHCSDNHKQSITLVNKMTRDPSTLKQLDVEDIKSRLAALVYEMLVRDMPKPNIIYILDEISKKYNITLDVPPDLKNVEPEPPEKSAFYSFMSSRTTSASSPEGRG